MAVVDEQDAETEDAAEGPADGTADEPGAGPPTGGGATNEPGKVEPSDAEAADAAGNTAGEADGALDGADDADDADEPEWKRGLRRGFRRAADACTAVEEFFLWLVEAFGGFWAWWLLGALTALVLSLVLHFDFPVLLLGGTGRTWFESALLPIFSERDLVMMAHVLVATVVLLFPPVVLVPVALVAAVLRVPTRFGERALTPGEKPVDWLGGAQIVGAIGLVLFFLTYAVTAFRLGYGPGQVLQVFLDAPRIIPAMPEAWTWATGWVVWSWDFGLQAWERFHGDYYASRFFGTMWPDLPRAMGLLLTGAWLLVFKPFFATLWQALTALRVGVLLTLALAAAPVARLLLALWRGTERWRGAPEWFRRRA